MNIKMSYLSFLYWKKSLTWKLNSQQQMKQERGVIRETVGNFS